MSPILKCALATAFVVVPQMAALALVCGAGGGALWALAPSCKEPRLSGESRWVT